ncbi:MAG: GNAT family N-acetyltransferase [candidate division KSB1 bacterium]|nr:GNAT family N-acetyltransferase [candidate division KSB1 bacterium]
MDAQIYPATIKESDAVAAVIGASFRQFAEKYPEHTRHSSVYPLLPSPEWVRKTMTRGAEYFLLRQEERPIGCAALIKINAEILFMDRLSVLPEFRREGYGKYLVHHCLQTAQKRGAKRVETGVPADLTELVEWYRSLGFRFKQLARFNELPFTVAFLYFNLKELEASIAEEENQLSAGYE